MGNFMNAETLYRDKKFVNAQLSSVPRYFWGQLSPDEIKSDLALAICTCVKTFDSTKSNNIAPYIRRSFINNIKNTLRDKQFIKESEAPLEAAYSHTYEDQPIEKRELIAYLSSLPNTLLSDLTEFVLGKKNKEEIVSNPSFKKINIDRILSKLDGLL